MADRQGFIEPGKAYVNDFRNEAAHPNYMQEPVATECMNQTSTLVKRFLDAQR